MPVNLIQNYPLQDTDLNTYFYHLNRPYSPVYIRYEYGYVDPFDVYTKIGPTNRIPLELAVGRVRPNFILDERAQVGSYKIIWKFKASENSPIKERVDYFYVVTEGLYKNFTIKSTYDRLRVLFYTLTPNDVFNKYVVLPNYLYSASINVVHGGSLQPGSDYIYSGYKISWSGLGLEGTATAGTTFRVLYVEEDIYKSFTPYETLSTTFHEITPQDFTNKFILLPDNMVKVALNVVYGTAAQLGVDYSFSENRISWGGLGFDGDIHVGDVLRIIYVEETCPQDFN